MVVQSNSSLPSQSMHEIDSLLNLLYHPQTTPALRASTLQALPDSLVLLLETRRASRSFLAWLKVWQFVGREGTGIHTFAAPWPGQQAFAELAELLCWILDLKAGKQGHSELECAFDGWAAWSGPPNSRVHIFSRNAREAQEFLEIVRFGLTHLPPHFGVRLLNRDPGGDTTTSLRFAMGADDVRTIVAYPATPDVSISQSAWHVHVDELAHVVHGKAVYDSVSTTVSPGGTLHVVSRGKGPDDMMAQLWASAVPEGVEYADAHAAAIAAFKAGDTQRLIPLFVPYTARPGRDAAWYESESRRLTASAMRHYAPETPAEALSGDADEAFVEESQWDQLETVLPIEPGDRTPLVIALDAGVKSDHFALVGATRCPVHHEDPAVRLVHEWVPSPTVSFAEVKDFLRRLYQEYNVVCTVYDRYALDDMAQELGGSAWWDAFDQGTKRLVADAAFRQRIVERRMARIPSTVLRDAVTGAGVRLDRDERKLRIVKRTAKKVDAAVAASMATYAVMELNL